MRFRTVWLWLILALPLAAWGREQQPAAASPFKGEFIYLRDYGTDDIGYLTLPDTPPQAGVVLVPDGHGIDAWMKIAADNMAQKGCIVLALDLYNGNVTADDRQAARMESDLMEKGVLASLKTATVFFQQSPRFKMDKVFIIGIGPMSAQLIEFAAQKNVTVSGMVVINPARIPTAAGLKRLRYPMLFQLGVRSTEAVEMLTQLVKETGTPDLVEIKTVPKLNLGARRLDENQWSQIAEFIRKNSTEERRKNLLQRIFE